jgi:hypothetical protein
MGIICPRATILKTLSTMGMAVKTYPAREQGQLSGGYPQRSGLLTDGACHVATDANSRCSEQRGTKA